LCPVRDDQPLKKRLIERREVNAVLTHEAAALEREGAPLEKACVL
jgi:hypothetical protein